MADGDHDPGEFLLDKVATLVGAVVIYISAFSLQ